MVGLLPMRVGEKGQVTIPKDLRDALGIGAGSQVTFEASTDGDALVVRKVEDATTRGQQVVDRLRGRDAFAMTTDEIMALTRAGCRPSPLPARSRRPVATEPRLER